jgi:hypothetical protein
MPQSVFLFYAASFMPSSLGPLPRGASVRHQLAFKGEATLYLFRYGVGEESGDEGSSRIFFSDQTHSFNLLFLPLL